MEASVVVVVVWRISHGKNKAPSSYLASIDGRALAGSGLYRRK